MISASVFGLRVRLWMKQSGFEPLPGSLLYLDKTLNSHQTSLCPGVQMGTSKFNAGGNLVMD